MILNLTKHLVFAENTKGNDYLVGDVHGHYEELMYELKMVKFNAKKDRVFSLGDLCNRGEDSKKCLKLLLCKEFPFYAVEGNHESMLRELMKNADIEATLSKGNVGGQWAIDCFEQEPTEFKFLCGIIFAKCYNAITLKTKYGDVGLIHAQSPDDWSVFSNGTVSEQELFDGLWSLLKYSMPDSELKPVKNIALTVHGHTNSHEIVVKKNMVWIDTLRNSGRLTLINVKDVFKLVKKERTLD